MVKKQKHILFIVENNPVPHDVRVWREAVAARDFGYKVSVICPQNDKAPKRYENIDGIDIYRHFIPFEAEGKLAFLLEYGNAILWEFLYCFMLFFKDRFDVIHSANPPDHVFLFAWFFKLLGVKYIFDHHDICPENYVAKFHRKDFLYRIMVLMEKLNFKVADMVISTNESYKKVAITRGKKDPEKVFVVRNGPDLADIPPTKPNPKRWKNGYNNLVCYVGVIGNQEGIDVLLRIVDYILNDIKFTDIKFIIIGTGPHLDKMILLRDQMGLNEHVIFTGYIPYEDFYEILATSDVCVNPEHRNAFTDKSTMLKIMDYMTFAKPIVQFETTEGRVTAENAAIYIRDNDEKSFAASILALLNDSEKRNAMGRLGRKRIDEILNWSKQKQNLYKAYRHIDTMN